MMNQAIADRITFLSGRYEIDWEIVARLMRLSFVWQSATSETLRGQAMRAYDKIVRERCAGIDPLV